MPDLELHSFTADDTADVRAALEINNAVLAADAPWEFPELFGQYDASLRHGWDGEPATPYLLSVDGVPVGTASLSLTERENTHLAWVEVAVHPDHRRRGHGRALFERMVEEAIAAGRTSVATDGWESDRATGFAAAFGLEKKSQEIMRRQALPELDRGLLDKLFAEASASAVDYELVRLPGRTPPELLDDVAELAAAINDAPTDDLDIEDDVMSSERLVAYEDAVEARGHRMYRLVARHRRSGELGGHTVIGVESQRPALAHQHDTAVARTHRGHRLGLLLKAGMLLWLAEAEPQVESVDTWNAESNDHMISVNEALGYQVLGRVLEFQRSL